MKYLWGGHDGNGETTTGFTALRADCLLCVCLREQDLHFNENGAKWKDSPKADDDRWLHEPKGGTIQHGTIV